MTRLIKSSPLRTPKTSHHWRCGMGKKLQHCYTISSNPRNKNGIDQTSHSPRRRASFTSDRVTITRAVLCASSRGETYGCDEAHLLANASKEKVPLPPLTLGTSDSGKEKCGLHLRLFSPSAPRFGRRGVTPQLHRQYMVFEVTEPQGDGGEMLDNDRIITS